MQHVDQVNTFNAHALADLKRDSRQNDEATLRKAAEQFESLFLHMMLKNMRSEAFRHDLYDQQKIDMYRDMQDQQLASHMASAGGIGLADALVRQMQGQVNRITPTAPASGEVYTGLKAEPLETVPDVPEEFVAALMPHAQEAAEQLGVKPDVLVAQAALETGWGKHMMQDRLGRPSYNFFGIKAHGWDGRVTEQSTLEFSQGRMRPTRALFRAYESMRESFNDYARFIQDNPRYAEALQQADSPEGYLRELQAAGYATDPNYANKILRVMESPTFRQAWRADADPDQAKRSALAPDEV